MLSCINLAQGLINIHCKQVAELAVHVGKKIKISLIKFCVAILAKSLKASQERSRKLISECTLHHPQHALGWMMKK
jgi:HD-GYP domain-containing protein (c-di-GMP phosphodiesterase class II)